MIDVKNSYVEFLDDPAKEILKLAETCTEQELCKQFAKNKKVVDFIRELDNETFKMHVRPFIDRQLEKTIQIAERSSINIFFRQDREEGGRCIVLSLPTETASPQFHFKRSTEGIIYRLEISFQGRAVNLQDKKTKIVTYSPCLLKSDNQLVRFPDGFDGMKLTPFLTKRELNIPVANEKAYMEKFVIKNVRTGDVYATGFDINDLDIDPIMDLSLETDWQGSSIFVVWFQYAHKRIMAGKLQKTFVDLEYEDENCVFTRITRKIPAENNLLNSLLTHGLKRKNENTLELAIQKSSPEQQTPILKLVEWVNRNSELFRESDIIVSQPKGEKIFFKGTISLDIHVDDGIDWFDIRGMISFDELKISFSELRPYILNNTREFMLPNGQIACLPEEWFSTYKDIFVFSVDKGESIRVNRHHYPIVKEIQEVSGSSFAEIADRFNSHRIEDVRIPENLKASLRPYQAEGLQWLQFQQQIGFGGCLADDMGLGKTIQTVALLLSSIGKSKHASLLVMPTSLIHNWRNEIRRFAPSLSSLIHIGPDRHGNAGMFDAFDLILTTYGTLRRDVEWLSKYTFYYIILDEGQVIRNPDSKVAKAAFDLQSVHKLSLTGTPVQNSLTDLWSQMNFLNPGLLGSFSWFQKEFEPKHAKINAEEDLLRIKKLVTPFLLRRKKEEVEPDLPELTQNNWYCEMDEPQRKLYETEKSAARNFLLDHTKDLSGSATMHILKALIRLRQLANHPRLVFPDFEGTSGKAEQVLQNLETLVEENHKVLIFSSFVKYLDFFAKEFKGRGWKYSILTGATRDREVLLRNFRTDPDKNIFLISLKAGGEGLNLVEADYVYLLDPWWNPAAEQQAIARAHRIGQVSKVFAYNYITKDTIEEKMLQLQEQKSRLTDYIIQPNNPLKDLKSEEIAWLFE